jgi:hypothetical protein
LDSFVGGYRLLRFRSALPAYLFASALTARLAKNTPTTRLLLDDQVFFIPRGIL